MSPTRMAELRASQQAVEEAVASAETQYAAGVIGDESIGIIRAARDRTRSIVELFEEMAERQPVAFGL